MCASKVLAALLLTVSSKSSAAQWPCKTVSVTDQGHVNASEPTGNTTCYENVVWAKERGILQHPDWYPGLNTTSSHYDFQWAIYKKHHVGEPGVAWGCDLPCGKEQEALALGMITNFPTPTPTPAPTEEAAAAGSSSIPWWTLLLLALCLLCCAIAACVYFSGLLGGKASKPQKKKGKRGLVVAPTPVAAPVVVQAPTPTISTAVPMAMPMQEQRSMVMTTAPPVYMQAAPQVAAPAPMTYAAPVSTPMTYAAPAPTPMTYQAQAPMTYAAAAPTAYVAQAGGAMSLFDQLDRNHDGSISRAEFMRATGQM